MEKVPKYRFKYFRLCLYRTCYKLKKFFTNNKSILFLIFSLSFSLAIIFPSFFDKIPVYSYFIEELDLPYTYKVSGNIEIIYNSGISDREAEIFIGGYNTTTDESGDFELVFSSPKVDRVYVVILYELKGKEHQEIVEIKIPQSQPFELIKEVHCCE